MATKRSRNFKRKLRRPLDYGNLSKNLIAAIKEEVVLYHKAYSRNRKIGATMEAWKRVSAALGVSVDSCKKQWKNLRDRYIKQLRARSVLNQQQQQQQQANKPVWAYYDQLSFLNKHIQIYRVGDVEHSKSEGSISQEDGVTENRVPDNGLESNELSSEAMFCGAQANYIEIAEYDELCEGTPHTKGTDYAYSGITQSKSTSPLTTALNTSGEQHPQAVDGTNTNSEERFLLSCAPALQRLSKQKNAFVRLRIQQLLYDMEFGAESDGETGIA